MNDAVKVVTITGSPATAEQDAQTILGYWRSVGYMVAYQSRFLGRELYVFARKEKGGAESWDIDEEYIYLGDLSAPLVTDKLLTSLRRGHVYELREKSTHASENRE